MRLINTKTFKLETFDPVNAPPYAILSHTWGNDDEELLFEDVQSGNIKKSSLGWTKLHGSCQQAQQDGLDYVWIDTCCIDKTKSAELNEAINSMFRWYRQSAFCYVYLTDVSQNENPVKSGSKFRKSRWFTRGWTLQELVAPQTVLFYSSEWQCIGNKGNMCTTIMEITGIPRPFLLGIADIQQASVAQRMSWAAQRETSKDEDLPYSLLGIFGVMMPLIYGEGGKKAFFRLQEEIMKRTKDDSIFAWGFGLEASFPEQVIGGKVLATAASDFADSGHIVSRQFTRSLSQPKFSGGRLHVHLPLVEASSQQLLALLNCGPIEDSERAVGIPLVRPNPAVLDDFIRPRGSRPVLMQIRPIEVRPEPIHILNAEQVHGSLGPKQHYWFCEQPQFSRAGLDLIDVAPHSCYDEDRSLILPDLASAASTDQILLRFRQKETENRDFVVLLDKTDSSANPGCYIMVCDRDTAMEQLANDELQTKMQRSLGEDGASNGSLHLRVILELVEDQLLTIKPEIMLEPPTHTVDASVELLSLAGRQAVSV